MDKIRTKQAQKEKQTETVAEGVRIRSGKCWLDFRWESKRYFESTDFNATTEGKRAAARVRGKIVTLIDLGEFSREKFVYYFPKSKRSIEFLKEINQDNEEIPTFSDVAREALSIKEREVSPEHLKKLKGFLNTWWMPYLAGLKINEIDEDTLENIDAELDWKSSKTRNNALAPLRLVFEKAMRKRIRVNGIKAPILDMNPVECLRNGKVSKPEPDPFEPHERDAILTYFAKLPEREIIWFHYFTVAFFTGMRTNELIGLEWEQIDFRKEEIKVDRAMVSGKIRMQTKTGTSRTVPMLPMVLQSLKAMKQFTFLAGKNVFASPRYINQPFWGPKAPNDAFQHCLKKLGIRQRRTYNTRHSFATQMLMDNVKPGFAAKILGHSLMVFFSTYAKWLEGDQTEKEMSKITLPETQSGGWLQIGYK